MTLTPDQKRLHREVARRRTFAIISHPDAGKTTLTEKLLLYGGAIHLAGSVKARRASRHALAPRVSRICGQISAKKCQRPVFSN